MRTATKLISRLALAACTFMAACTADAPRQAVPSTGPPALAPIRATADAFGGVQRTGDFFHDDLFSANVADADPGSAQFTPLGTENLTDMAVAVYSFTVPELSAVARLRLHWDSAPLASDLYIGVSSWDAERWHWLQPTDPGTIDLSPAGEWIRADGAVFVALVLIGGEPATLDILRLVQPSAETWAQRWDGDLPTTVFTQVAEGHDGSLYYSGFAVGNTDTNIVLARFSATNDFIWGRTWRKEVKQSGHGLGVDADGNVWLGGYVGELFAGDGADSLLLKISPEGELLREVQLGLDLDDVIFGLASHGDSVYATGWVNLSDTDRDLLLLEFDLAGDLQQQWRYGLAFADEGKAVAVAEDGTVYVCGTTTENYTSSNGLGLLLKLGSDLSLQGQITYGASGAWDDFLSIVLTGPDELWVGGRTFLTPLAVSQDGLVVRFDSDLEPQLGRVWHTAGHDNVWSIDTDGFGGVWCLGAADSSTMHLTHFGAAGDWIGSWDLDTPDLADGAVVRRTSAGLLAVSGVSGAFNGWIPSSGAVSDYTDLCASAGAGIPTRVEQFATLVATTGVPMDAGGTWSKNYGRLDEPSGLDGFAGLIDPDSL